MRLALIPPKAKELVSAVRIGPDSLLVDTAAAAAFVREFGTPPLPPLDEVDPAPRQTLEWVRCPGVLLAEARGVAPPDSLASPCNLR